jgi:hypothetical protein
LELKAADSRFKDESVREQIERKSCHPSPISFRIPEGAWGRAWLGVGVAGGKEWIVGDDRHWRDGIAKATEPHDPSERRAKAIVSHAGFKVRLLLQDEAPEIGSGFRLITVQFRGKKVKLHYGACTATITRVVFKELVASNRAYRKRDRARPALRLIAGSKTPQLLNVEDAA